MICLCCLPFSRIGTSRIGHLRSRLTVVSILNHQVVFVFVCLKISTLLFADTYSLQSKANWRAWHQPKVYTISKLSKLWLGVSILKPPWKYCICVTISVRGTILLKFSKFLFQNLGLTNVKGILIHMFILFFYSGDFYKHILNTTFA